MVQTDDNTTYYRTNFEGEYSEHAVPFVDSAVDLKEPSSNIIIYGHNIRADGQMFNILKGYKELDYYKEHPVINFDSVYHDGQYKIISVFYTNTKSEHGRIFPYHEFIDAKDAQEAQEFIDDVLIRSIINTGVDVRPSDQLLTLSTCTYEFKDARYVVVARKVRKGEKAEVDTSLASMNPNALYPDVWYKLFGGTKPDEAKLKSELPHDDVSAELLLTEPNSPNINDLMKELSGGTLIEEQDYLIESEIERKIRATMQEGSYENLEDMKNGEEAETTEETAEETAEPEPAEPKPEHPAEEQKEEEVPLPQSEEPEVQAEQPPEAAPETEPQQEEPIEPAPDSEEEEVPDLTEEELKEAEVPEDEAEETEAEEEQEQDERSTGNLSVKINGKTTHGSAYDIVSRMVEAEMGSTFHPEALKAQAVAAYTYVSYNNQKGISPWVAAKDNVSANVRNAVEDVLGEAVCYNGSYINATYCASNAGQSMDAEGVWGGYLPYLVSVDSPGDTDIKAYGATTTLSEDEVAEMIEDYCNVDPYDYGTPDEWFENPEYTNGLYVDSIDVCGQNFSGRSVRENLLESKIKSAAFEVDYDGDEFTFTTYGYGHGVGMSQMGAEYFAKQGWSYVDILTHYYEGTTVQ